MAKVPQFHRAAIQAPKTDMQPKGKVYLFARLREECLDYQHYGSLILVVTIVSLAEV